MARKRGNSWQADALVNGERVRKQFRSQLEALAWEQQPSLRSMFTVGELFTQCYEHYWRGTKNAKDAYRITNELISLIGKETDPKEVTSAKALELVNQWRTKGNSTETINRKLAALSKCMGYARLKVPNLVLPTITYFKKARGRIRFLTKAEEERLFHHIPQPYKNLAMFLLYTGCRYGEAVKLQWQDMIGADTDSLTATFWETKGGGSRSIPLPRKARDAAYNDWTMPNDRGPFTTIDYDAFSAAWHKAKHLAGLGDDDQVVPHVLRHTCVSRLVQGGVDLRRVKEWAGHSDIRTTLLYAHLAPGDLVSAATILV